MLAAARRDGLLWMNSGSETQQQLKSDRLTCVSSAPTIQMLELYLKTGSGRFVPHFLAHNVQ
jgi:hypothetical protein